MAEQKTPHTNTHQNLSAAVDDLDPNMNPQDTYRSDRELYEKSDGAQTGGTRAFNANEQRDTLPKSIDEGTASTEPRGATLPEPGGTGVTTHSSGEERAQQEKVAGR